MYQTLLKDMILSTSTGAGFLPSTVTRVTHLFSAIYRGPMSPQTSQDTKQLNRWLPGRTRGKVVCDHQAVFQLRPKRPDEPSISSCFTAAFLFVPLSRHLSEAPLVCRNFHYGPYRGILLRMRAGLRLQGVARSDYRPP